MYSEQGIEAPVLAEMCQKSAASYEKAGHIAPAFFFLRNRAARGLGATGRVPARLGCLGAPSLIFIDHPP